MPEQQGFFFDAPLMELPPTQLQPRAILPPARSELLSLSAPELIALLREISNSLSDDINVDEMLGAAGFPSHALTGWHRARAMDALMPPEGEFQAYIPHPGQVRFRRLAPYQKCGGEGCETPTRGSLCPACRLIEEEDLFNRDE